MDMHEAIIVTLKEDTQEIRQLTKSLDYKIKNVFIQKRRNPDVNSYIGSGKVEEIKEYIEKNQDVKLMIVDGELKPSQWFYLEKELKIDVSDRVNLILKIFETRAERKEARYQVKLAQLQYERPYVRELIHRARNGEHPGFMAGGEYQVDDYFEMIKKQTKKIRQELDKIREDRKLRRRYRHKSGYYLVSLAGYTNAGKSSLLNVLSKEKVKVEGKLFSTLSTTTRKIIDNKIPILLTDTVGFIKDLPAIIIQAFHSTLEEIENADVVLLVIDISEREEVISEKINVSLNELIELGVSSPIILVFNKIDKISESTLEEKKRYLIDSEGVSDQKNCFISIKEKIGIDILLDTIYASLPHIADYKVKIPLNENTQSFISWIYDNAYVKSISYDDYAYLSLKSSFKIKEMILSKIKQFK